MPRSSLYRIDLPIKKYSSTISSVNVLPSSSKLLRLHVERFALYFLGEMRTGGIQFSAAEKSCSPGFRHYHAILVGAEDRHVGAIAFRYRPEQCKECPWILDWIWIHPYFRRAGILTAVWPVVIEQFGIFRLSEPISPAMRQFLLKVRHGAA